MNIIGGRLQSKLIKQSKLGSFFVLRKSFCKKIQTSADFVSSESVLQVVPTIKLDGLIVPFSDPVVVNM